MSIQEIEQNVAKLKNMATGETSDIVLDEKFIEDFVTRVTMDEDNQLMETLTF